MNETSLKRVRVDGSERTIVPGATYVGPTDSSQWTFVTVLLRRRSAEELSQRVEEMSVLPPVRRTYVSREEFASVHGAYPGDVAQIEQFAKEYSLSVERIDTASRTVVMSGRVAAMNAAFGIELGDYQHRDFSYRGHEGPVRIPEHLSGVVTAVLGLDNRPQAKPHFRIFRPDVESTPHRAGTPISYTPNQVAQLYHFPTGANCKDQCIGIIELGGGYSTQNIDQYFTDLGLPLPSVTAVSVDGAVNQPTGNAGGPDGEVDLDIEVAASIAPGARIAVYFAPNTDAGFLNAIKAAVHDTTNKPSVISISWGGPEISWSTQAMQAMNSALQDAAALGVTVCCAAGDNGSTDGVNDGNFHVDFPASAPYALACGGTRLIGSGSSISSETVWNDGTSGGATGGGVSAVFPLPSWQANAHVPPSANPGATVGRGVPDVAGDADPATGYQVLVDGQQLAIGGTSAVAPLWAGLLALANHSLGHSAGFINPILYSIPSSGNAFRDITSGNNDPNLTGDIYPAGPGWDACTGLGSPVGQNLIAALSK
ncbi:S53 family peptidase [Alicyclobacillus sp. ALC3]|uniref:S53 family peptidase n=1 Tax=Alicyclobacillus sp. ALC3 TaxID=2796143 RepID=UPI0023790025|nr:S53 family peptidase [Alicyclobacillus sp. ALC3]WDL96262.1 S8/S53 family peptidase [Alicyclobacillus sp. ALC3]